MKPETSWRDFGALALRATVPLQVHPRTVQWWGEQQECTRCAHARINLPEFRCTAVSNYHARPTYCIDARDTACKGGKLFKQIPSVSLELTHAPLERL